MISGVWLANLSDPTGPISFAFSPGVKKWETALGVSAWLHIEVTTDILTAGWSDAAGVLQLRCSRGKKEPKEIVSALEAVIGPLDAMHIQYPSRTKRSADTFCVAKRTLLKSDLVFSKLERRLNEFAKCFGDFH